MLKQSEDQTVEGVDGRVERVLEPRDLVHDRSLYVSTDKYLQDLIKHRYTEFLTNWCMCINISYIVYGHIYIHTYMYVFLATLLGHSAKQPLA